MNIHAMMDDISKDITEVFLKMGGDKERIPGLEAIGILQVSYFYVCLTISNFRKLKSTSMS